MEGESINLNVRLVAALGIVLITGLVAHSFILAVNSSDWINGRLTSVTDRIITSIAISRVIFQTACIVNIFIIIFCDKRSMFLIAKSCFDFFELSGNYCNIWLSTLLSAAFCLKILHFHHVFFLRLKTTVSQRVTSSILFCGLVSVVHTAFITWLNLATELNHSPSDNQTSATYQIEKAVHYVYYFAFGNSLPFLIHMTCSVLLITFLCLHLNKIKHDNNLTTQLEPFYIGIKFMTVSFFSFALQVVISITILYYDYLLGFLSSYIIWTGFPCVHSMYLIYRTVKLKDCFLGIFRCGNNDKINNPRP